MKPPDHPAGPAFDKARDEQAQREQQRIAVLSRDQRNAFDEIRHRQRVDEARLARTQAQRYPKETAERMRQNLLQQKEPHLTPGAHRHKLKDSQDLGHAINDFIGGRQNRIVNAYRMEFNRAHRVGRNTVRHQHAQERAELHDKHRQERERFLSHAERARGRGAKEEFRDKAKAPEQPSKAFDKAARDPSFRRAFDRAARKEAEHERTNERALTKTFEDKARPRERTSERFDKAARDPSMQRAFTRAARTEQDNRDGPNRDRRDGPGINR